MATRPGGGEATEQPTPRRLAEARRRGEVAVSRELSAAIGLAAAVAVLTGAAPTAIARIVALMRASLGRSFAADGTLAAAGAGLGRDTLVALLALPLAVAVAVALLAGLLQTGGLFARDAVRLDLGRLAWRGHAGRRLVDGARALAGVTIVVVVACVSLGTLVPRALPRLAGAPPGAVLAALAALTRRAAIGAALALVGLGMADWLLARRRHRLSLLMTRAEVERDRRETEGDPRRKAERRRLRGQLGARTGPRFQDADVARARFVVCGADTAVAVRYDPALDAAPVVVAAVAGDGPGAARLEAIARAAGLPVHAEAALAEALAAVPEGRAIPRALYDAVAEVLRRIDGGAPGVGGATDRAV